MSSSPSYEEPADSPYVHCLGSPTASRWWSWSPGLSEKRLDVSESTLQLFFWSAPIPLTCPQTQSDGEAGGDGFFQVIPVGLSWVQGSRGPEVDWQPLWSAFSLPCPAVHGLGHSHVSCHDSTHGDSEAIPPPPQPQQEAVCHRIT